MAKRLNCSLIEGVNYSIYGLKQSLLCWNHALDGQLGFSQMTSDPCLYVLPDSEGEIFIVAVYVNDVILGCSSPMKINLIKKELTTVIRSLK